MLDRSAGALEATMAALSGAALDTPTQTSRLVAEKTHGKPWAGGDREAWDVDPGSVTGRRITG
ncbi:hypothetical protein [Streptomyces sp. NBC_00557]|uniref:hypothetical protein n=1 Tax=Streptomyces sp. NBC_00557 TaxID=2975776 RepID=UPI002E7FBD72|nr:hypothetical protein [Streptomyces sp. NBC_00557]WUC39470.1 hypothetical protein OG956_37325 [Streptomyces sp. NBC_00557]